MMVAGTARIGPTPGGTRGEGKEPVECPCEKVVGYPDMVVYVVAGTVRVGVSGDMST